MDVQTLLMIDAQIISNHELEPFCRNLFAGVFTACIGGHQWVLCCEVFFCVTGLMHNAMRLGHCG